MSPDKISESREPPEPVGGMGLAVLPQLLSSPAKAFERLRVDPRWPGTCLLVLAIVAAATWMRLPQDLLYAQEGVIAGMERFGASDEDIDEMLAGMPDPENLPPGTVVTQVLQGLAGWAALQFLAALVLHGIARLAGAEPRFRASLAVYWTAAVATAAGALLKAALVRAQDSVAVSLGPAALTGLDHRSLGFLFLEIFDLFAVLTLLLLVTGVRVVFGTSRGAAWGIGGGFWAIGSLLRFGMTAGFSWFSGTL